MKFRFEVNRVEAFRRGIDVPKSLVTIEVRASNLTLEQRHLIADRLDGIDVVKLHYDPKTRKLEKTYYLDSRGRAPRPEPVRIQANLPTFDAMMEAIEGNEAEVKKARQQILLKLHGKPAPNPRASRIVKREVLNRERAVRQSE